MTDTRSLNDIVSELRRHPDCAAVIVWQYADAEAVGVDPGSVDWSAVEDRGIEVGWEVISAAEEEE